jgi:hypothetical protein
MNLVTELENELVFALLVEKKHLEAVNSEKALALIDKIKAALQSNLIFKREKETNMLAGKKAIFFSH